MERLVFLLALLCIGSTEYQDLSDKVFTFPTESATSWVRLNATVEQPIKALTVCVRFFSSLTRGQSLFSVSVPSESNAILIYKYPAGVYQLYVGGSSISIYDMPDNTREWNSLCWTWDSATGLTALWVNNKRSERKILSKGITAIGAPIIILGQDQDSYGGGFSWKESFTGDITDVHMWDSVITPCEIKHYLEGSSHSPGNILNWLNLDYSITDSVYVQDSDFNVKTTCY
ncbi:uncharacterized protein V6R79_009567 [Siganus canaliculatus]